MLRASGLALAGGAALLAGCRGADVATEPSRELAALADRYTHLTLQLARQQPSLVEQWLGPADQAATPRLPVVQLRVDVATLQRDTTALLASDAWRRYGDGLSAASGPVPGARPSDLHRAAYLAGQVRALDAAAGRLLGDSHAFGDEATRLLGHAAPARDAAALDALREELSVLLPGDGSLAARHAAFRRAAAVPPGRVEAVFAAAVQWCRTSSAARLPLPSGETLTTRAEDTAGWAAFSRPSGPLSSDLWVARRGGADVAHLLQLAAHEGTPGHHAQHVLASAALVQARGWPERRLYPGFGPHRLCAEGAAEAGADLLLPEDVRIGVCRDVLLPAAGQAPTLAASLVRIERRAAALDLEVAHIAADYLDTPLGSEAATARLRDDALVLDPAGMLAFVEKQRVYALAYPLGRRLVTAALGDGGADTRWARLALIATTMTLATGSGE